MYTYRPFDGERPGTGAGSVPVPFSFRDLQPGPERGSENTRWCRSNLELLGSITLILADVVRGRINVVESAGVKAGAIDIGDFTIWLATRANIRR